MATSELPSGWSRKTIIEICDKPQYGHTASAQIRKVGPKLLRITDIQNGRVEWDKVPYCECDDIEKYELRAGDILFARTGATTGKSFLVKDPPEAVFASYLIRLRVGPCVLPEYLFHYFQSPDYWFTVFSDIEDGNRPNMNGTKLARLPVVYPVQKTEQRRIVARIDELQVQLETLQMMREEIDTELASFMPALMAKAFRGEL